MYWTIVNKKVMRKIKESIIITFKTSMQPLLEFRVKKALSSMPLRELDDVDVLPLLSLEAILTYSSNKETNLDFTKTNSLLPSPYNLL